VYILSLSASWKMRLIRPLAIDFGRCRSQTTSQRWYVLHFSTIHSSIRCAGTLRRHTKNARAAPLLPPQASPRQSEAGAESLSQAEAADKDTVVDLSVRFKHGITTVYLLVDPSAPFAKVTDALLEAVRERYPGGLTTPARPAKTAMPAPGPAEAAAPATVVYALPKNPADPSQGWQRLKIGEDDTPYGKGLTENCMVAFAILAPGQDEAEAEFEVTLPTLDDE